MVKSMHLHQIGAYLLGFSLALASNSVLAQKPQVIGWIPAYGVDKSMQILQSNPHIPAGLTRIGLQFWNPSVDGKSVVLAPTTKNGHPLSPEEVRRVVAWAKQNHLQVLLTVYNNSQTTNKWDWELAKRAFKDHPKAFGASLIATMQQFELDGIDLDLEGEENFEEDRASYAKFVKDLSISLKKYKKLLTIDSFHSPCANAPNMNWWRDWLGQVDAIHSMGYQDLYEGSTASFTPENKPVCEGGAAIFKYSWQLAYGKNAGYRADQIVMGMPTWLANWGEGGLGSSLSAHLQEAKTLGVGIALWDLQLGASPWRSAETWAEIQQLRGNRDEKVKVKTKIPAKP